MSAIVLQPAEVVGARGVHHTTLLELIHELDRVIEDPNEVVAIVVSLLDSGRVRLTGSFRGLPVRALRADPRC